MKKRILIITLFIVSVIGSFLLGKSQVKPINPSIKDYIECDSVETFFINGDELHIIANNGNEYVFTK